MHFSLLALGALVVSAVAVPAPSANHVVHEKRNGIPHSWAQYSKPAGTEVLPMRIALTQGNLDKGDDFLMDVSHPESANFGKHWSAQRIAETFAPSAESIDSVIEWLKTSGIAPERVSKSQSLGWLTFDATVDEAENLLKTEYHIYKHASGKPHVACSKYHVPEHVVPHIDFITPTVHFDSKIPMADEEVKRKQRRVETTSTAAAGVPVKTHAALNIGSPNSGSLPKKGTDISIFGFLDQLKNCNKYITPNCLRVLYEFLPGFTANPANSYGVVEYTPQAYLQNDLNLFFANFSRNQVQKTPTLDSIDGGVDQTTMQGFQYNGESDLDLEYAMTLVNPQKVTLYQVGDLVEGASFNNFLDAIDGSYCTFQGGDDPTQDAKYPDPFGGYQGPENCGGFAATKVISTSYGYNEVDLTAKYEMRQCAEYMKLGLAGTTILYSSGDYGVAGNGGQCIDAATHQLNNGTSGMFNPSFPGTCPYVTSIGATQIKPGASVTAPEEACETVIYSGGGFSNVFGLPSYQAGAVKSFFANHPPPYGPDRYNNTQQSRGIPDISANGANYVVAIDGKFSLVYGTSASTPVVGAIITLINEARLNLGKGSVGFINPTLYANPGALNDITSGGNQGCGTPGFTATTGWDPVTGLGTPNFPKLLLKFLELPFCLRRVAFRVLSSPSSLISAKPRSFTTFTSSTIRTTNLRLTLSPLQRRFASEEVTQAEPEADGATEAQHGENSIAASSESEVPQSADQGEHATVTSAIKAAAGSVAGRASDAVETVTASATTARDTASNAFSGVASTKPRDRGPPAAEAPKSNTVYVGNLFFDVTTEDLRREFEKAGTVTKVKIVYDQRGLSKGFGYVDFVEQDSAEKAIKMFNMENFEGRRLAVQYTLKRDPRPGSTGRFPDRTQSPPTATLFIGNMAFDMSDRDLNDLFREIKNVIDVRVAIDRRTGQPRGFAHADFVDVESAEKAMAVLTDKEVCGRVLRIDYSQSTGRNATPQQGDN